MKTIASVTEFKILRESLSGTIGFVPTMGALHDGHLSLIEKSNQLCKHTIVSIYINPTQFSPNEDFNLYPKSLKNDLMLLNKFHIDAVFIPTDETMYPQSYSTFISENMLSKKLEGKSRPNFFLGVVTVVAKLFNIVNPTHSFFGEKDAQQLRIITKMVKDLNFPIKIIPCPTIRDKNGLAMSSRNKYLSKSSLKLASIIYKALCFGVSLLNSGERNSGKIKKEISKIILSEPITKIDYVSIANNSSLKEFDGEITGDIIISTAVFVNHVRLIDNISFSI